MDILNTADAADFDWSLHPEEIIDVDGGQSEEGHVLASFEELESIPVNNFLDVKELKKQLGFFASLKGYDILYRGHALPGFELKPSIARGTIIDYSQELELLPYLKKICRNAGYEKYRLDNFNENLFYLSIGRHLGFNCRLLDWTLSLDTALFFLSTDALDNDGVLWVMAVPRSVESENRDPFTIQDDMIHILKEPFYIPASEDGKPLPQPLGLLRRAHQNGFFSETTCDLLDTPINEIHSNQGIRFLRYHIPSEVKKAWAQSVDMESWKEWILDKEDEVNKKVKDLNNLYKTI